MELGEPKTIPISEGKIMRIVGLRSQLDKVFISVPYMRRKDNIYVEFNTRIFR